MRRSWVFVSVLFIVATLVRFVPASAAPPASPSMYFGRTDQQGLPVELEIVRQEDGRLALRYVLAEIELTCSSDKRTMPFWVDLLYGSPLPMRGRALALDRVFRNQASHIRLHVEGRSVRGRINAAEAAFTQQEDLQRCDAPTQTFLAKPLPSPASTSVRGSGSPSAAVGSTTRYHGTTSQALPIFFDLLGTAQLGSLATADLFSGLSCDDGTTFSWTIGLIQGPPVVERAFSVDAVQLRLALRWRGRIGDTRARGHLRVAVPAFTEEEDLQTCSSGHVGWIAKPGV